MFSLGCKQLAPWLLAGALAITGCADEDNPGSGDTEDTEDSSDTDDSMSTTTSGTTTGETTDTTTTTTTTDSSTTTTTDGGSTTGVQPQPDGAECTVDAECESGKCYFISLLGGVCGECNEDADCPDGGCTPPNPLVEPAIPPACNDGELGGGCETTEVCQDDLTCVTFIEVPSVATISTCAECESDADCAGGQQCAPQIDVANFSGQFSCVDDGSVPAGQGCDLAGEAEECEAGLLCAAVDVGGFVEFGLCAECGVNADCTEMDEVCNDPDVNLETGEITPPMCGPPA